MLQQNLTELLHTSGYNKPGVCAVLGVPKEWVTSMPNTLSLLQTTAAPTGCDFYIEEIVLATGKTWLDLSKHTRVNIDFTDEEAKTLQGSSFTYNIPLTIPHDDFDTRAQIFRAYQNREWILIVKQRTGAWRVIGSLQRGAVFTTSLNSGTIKTGASLNTTGFTWQCGEQRAYYVTSFLSGSYWFRVNGTSEPAYHKLQINEPVIINWGDGVFNYYGTGYGALQTIIHAMVSDGDNYSYVVYHRHQATALKIIGETIGDDTYNSTATEILGTLPSPLVTLHLQGNDLLAFPKVTLHMNGSDNKLNDAAIEVLLEEADTGGALNGTANFALQTPAVTPTGDMITFKANLEGKGWTVTY